MGLYFYFWVALLAVMLFFPVSKLIWALSVRRLERKRGEELTMDEIENQKTRARFITVILVTGFSWLFNLQMLGTANG